MQTISTAALHGRLDAVTLVEALGSSFYEAGHLPGALNVPPDLVAQLAGEVLPDRGAPIVVYSSNAGCGCAAVVARRLTELDYRDVTVYRDGKEGWVEAGLLLAYDDDRARRP